MISGEVQFSFANVPAILGHVRSGRIRALAVLADKRSDLMPDVPTMKEAGVDGVVVPVWYALLAPAATPREIVKVLKDAKMKKVQAAIQGDQVRVTSASRDELQAAIQLLKNHDFGIALQFGNYRS